MTAPPPSAADGSLLLYCLGVRHPGWGDRRPPALTGSDWTAVLHQAGANGVTPLLYHRLKTAVPAPYLPSPALEQLRDACVLSAAKSLQIGRELAQILEAFERHQVPVVVLKGAHLAPTVYGSLALRTMCDLDLLVRRPDLPRATEILAGLGYADQYFGVEEVDYTRHHHLRPMAKPGGIRVELHWTIVQPTAPFDLDVDGLWQRARHAEVAGVDVLVLSPADLVLHLCLHASFGHKFRLGLRPCWDLLEVVGHYGRTLDWNEVVGRSRLWRVEKYVYVTLRLVRELLAADIPPSAIAALEPRDFPPEIVGWARACIFAPDLGAAVSPSMARLWTARRLKAKLTVLFRTLYPPRPTMARIYGTPPGSARIYFYYAVRWADLLRRYGRRAWGLWRGHHDASDQLRAVSERVALDDWLRRPR